MCIWVIEMIDRHGVRHVIGAELTRAKARARLANANRWSDCRYRVVRYIPHT
jgi:hypothetical protein